MQTANCHHCGDFRCGHNDMLLINVDDLIVCPHVSCHWINNCLATIRDEFTDFIESRFWVMLPTTWCATNVTDDNLEECKKIRKENQTRAREHVVLVRMCVTASGCA